MRSWLRRLTPEPIRRLVRRWRDGDGTPRCGGMFAVYQPPSREVFARCDRVYGDAFRTGWEFLMGNSIRGDVLEFGTYRGYTARILARLIAEFRGPGSLWLYDSFSGLPPIDHAVDQASYEVAVNRVWFSGQMAVEEGLVPRLTRDLGQILPSGAAQIVPGSFAETVPDRLPASPVACVHLDCGLYASTFHVLSHLVQRGLLQDGTLLFFSDFNCNRASPSMGDRKALRDALSGQSQWEVEPFFSYGWNGQAFFVHRRDGAGDQG